MPDNAPELRGEVQYFRSNLLAGIDGLVHAFPCRTGIAGEATAVLAKRMNDAFSAKYTLMVKQIHGTRAVACDGGIEDARRLTGIEADAVMTRTGGFAAGVRTADCVPILIADPERRAVAAVHAGWKGLAAGVVATAVKKMRDCYSSRPQNLFAAIGPHIMSCCYEVGPEVASVFEKRFGSAVLSAGKNDRSYLNLSAAAGAALIEAGIEAARFDSICVCTRCNEDLFYSYRRDGKGAGRQLSFLFFNI